MKKVLTETTKIFTLVCCVFVMFSCGGDECQTCTMEGQADIEVCDEGGVGSGVLFDTEILANETAGYDCN